MFDYRQVFRKHALVDVVELLNHWARKVEHFHRRDFKSSLEDAVQDLAELALLHDVRLD
jgi:hypothetical protein